MAQTCPNDSIRKAGRSTYLNEAWTCAMGETFQKDVPVVKFNEVIKVLENLERHEKEIFNREIVDSFDMKIWAHLKRLTIPELLSLNLHIIEMTPKHYAKFYIRDTNITLATSSLLIFTCVASTGTGATSWRTLV